MNYITVYGLSALDIIMFIRAHWLCNINVHNFPHPKVNGASSSQKAWNIPVVEAVAHYLDSAPNERVRAHLASITKESWCKVEYHPHFFLWSLHGQWNYLCWCKSKICALLYHPHQCCCCGAEVDELAKVVVAWRWWLLLLVSAGVPSCLEPVGLWTPWWQMTQWHFKHSVERWHKPNLGCYLSRCRCKFQSGTCSRQG